MAAFRTKVRAQEVDWEKEYQKSQIWERRPHEYSALATKIVPAGSVLDLGCGEGYDCLYFASLGYDVTGIDISSTAIKRMVENAKRMDVNVRGFACDILDFYIEHNYDIIVSYGVLHFLGDQFGRYLAKLKQKTKPRGVHAFYIFSNRGDFYNIAKQRFHFPTEEGMVGLYGDWKILKLDQKNVELFIRGDRGEILHNDMIKILVQKP